MATTSIEWTEQTWNPVVGCTKVSPGCAHCYAETMAARLKGMALADIKAGRDPGKKRHYIDAIDDKGRWSGKLIPVPEALADPFSWKKPRRVFVNSMSDLFHESLPVEFIASVFGVMSFAPEHTFQVLTKRASLMYDFFMRYHAGDYLDNLNWWIDEACSALDPKYTKGIRNRCQYKLPLPNVHPGVSVENQQQAMKRIPFIARTPAAVRWLSVEPLLGSITFGCTCFVCDNTTRGGGGVCRACGKPTAWRSMDWIVVGGESGSGARACDIDWIRSIVRQCHKVKIPCFVKQVGTHVIDTRATVANDCPENECWPAGTRTKGQRIMLNDRKGGDPLEWPHDLRIRQYPAVK